MVTFWNLVAVVITMIAAIFLPLGLVCWLADKRPKLSRLHRYALRTAGIGSAVCMALLFNDVVVGPARLEVNTLPALCAFLLTLGWVSTLSYLCLVFGFLVPASQSPSAQS